MSRTRPGSREAKQLAERRNANTERSGADTRLSDCFKI